MCWESGQGTCWGWYCSGLWDPGSLGGLQVSLEMSASSRSVPQSQACTCDSSSLLQNTRLVNVKSSDSLVSSLNPSVKESCQSNCSHQFLWVSIFARRSRSWALDFQGHRISYWGCEVQQATLKAKVQACWSKIMMAYWVISVLKNDKHDFKTSSCKAYETGPIMSPNL